MALVCSKEFLEKARILSKQEQEKLQNEIEIIKDSEDTFQCIWKELARKELQENNKRR